MEEAEISGITVQSQLKANRFRDPISEKKKKKKSQKSAGRVAQGADPEFKP
jgi:ribosomal protein S21